MTGFINLNHLEILGTFVCSGKCESAIGGMKTETNLSMLRTREIDPIWISFKTVMMLM